MELVAVDWLKDVKRMDHVARRKGCAVQVCHIYDSIIVFLFNALFYLFLLDHDFEFFESFFYLYLFSQASLIITLL